MIDSERAVPNIALTMTRHLYLHFCSLSSFYLLPCLHTFQAWQTFWPCTKKSVQEIKIQSKTLRQQAAVTLHVSSVFFAAHHFKMSCVSSVTHYCLPPSTNKPSNIWLLLSCYIWLLLFDGRRSNFTRPKIYFGIT